MKGLWRHPRSKLPHYRTRIGGKPVYTRLPADLPHDHPDLIAAWAAAAKGKEKATPPAAGTIASLWTAAMAPDHTASLSKDYLGMLQRQSRKIIKKAGSVRATAVAAKHVRADIASANNKIARHKAWRFWGKYCFEKGIFNVDTTVSVKAPRSKTSGHPSWSTDDIAAFRKTLLSAPFSSCATGQSRE